MTIIEYIIIKRLLKKALITLKSTEITNDYFYCIDKDLVKEKDLSRIKRYVMIKDFNVTNLNKKVVVIPKDIFEHINAFLVMMFSYCSLVISIISIFLSIILNII